MEEKSAIRCGFIRFLNQILGQRRQSAGTETSWGSPHYSAKGKKAAPQAPPGARGLQLFRHSNDGGTNQWLERTQPHAPLEITRGAHPFDQVTSGRRRSVGFIAAIILGVSGNR